MDGPWPLVARQAALAAVLEAVADPSLQALVVTGPAGVGKTRLVSEVLVGCRDEGWATHWVAATRAAAGLPLAAVAHLLPDAAGVTPAPDLLAAARRRLTAGAAAAGAAAAGAAAAGAAVAGATGAAGAGGRRTLVGVDDVNLLDDASAVVLQHLAASRAAVLVCTLREGVRVPDPLPAMLASGSARLLRLELLGEPAVADLLVEVLDGPVDGAAVHRLHRLSGGNPLVLRELVTQALRDGALAPAPDLWHLTRRWAPGAGLPDLIRDRLADLTEEARTAAELLALAEPLEVALLEAVADPDALAALDDARLLAPVEAPRRQRVRLAHPVYAEALRADLPPLRIRLPSRRLATVLLDTGARRRQDALRLGVWWLAAGEAGDAVVLLRAAVEASAGFDHVLAERLARAALQAHGGFPATLALARSLRWQGRADEVDEVLADWESEASTDAERSQAALLGASVRRSLRGDAAAAEELLAKAEPLLTDPAARDELAAFRADVALMRWRPLEALALARPITADPASSALAVVRAAEQAAGALAMAGCGDEAVAVAEPGLRRSRSDPALRDLEDQLLLWCVLAHALSGRVPEARALADARYAAALELPTTEAQAWWGMGRSCPTLLGGQVGTAAGQLREARTLMRANPAARGSQMLAWVCSGLAEAEALRGDAEAATALVQEAEDILESGTPMAALGIARAWTSAALGTVTTARTQALAAAQDARTTGASGFEVLALSDAVRLGLNGPALGPVAQRLDELTGTTEGRLFPLLARLAAARRDADAATFEAVGAGLADLGYLLRAAEAEAAAAQLHAEARRTAQQQAAVGRARTLAARCEGARTPLLATLDRSAHVPAEQRLTDREREIAALAASGLPSRVIAERLVLSVRTVDNHLQRAYAKLGISRRADLPGGD